MDKLKKLLENSFDPAPAPSGTGGYGNSYGTPGGGNTTQDPDHFSSSDKTVNHVTPGSGSTGEALPERPDRKSSSGGTISPAVATDVQQSEKPLNPEDAYGPDVDKIFTKKQTPTPDEIMSALQYELSQMVKKDKTIAKRTVLQNLQKDPQYYSKLNMLNIDDKKMKVDETSTFSKTKNVLDEMFAKRQSQRQIEKLKSPELDEIFNNMWNKRQNRGKTKE